MTTFLAIMSDEYSRRATFTLRRGLILRGHVRKQPRFHRPTQVRRKGVVKLTTAEFPNSRGCLVRHAYHDRRGCESSHERQLACAKGKEDFLRDSGTCLEDRQAAHRVLSSHVFLSLFLCVLSAGHILRRLRCKRFSSALATQPTEAGGS